MKKIARSSTILPPISSGRKTRVLAFIKRREKLWLKNIMMLMIGIEPITQVLGSTISKILLA